MAISIQAHGGTKKIISLIYSKYIALFLSTPAINVIVISKSHLYSTSCLGKETAK